MCLLSNKITFCTCANPSVNELKNYWILYRHNKEKEAFCLGESMIPTSMLDFNFYENQKIILGRLNELDAFDTILEFQSNDILEIVINTNSKTREPYSYTYQFTDGKWETKEFDPFDLINHFDKKVKGKIKNVHKK